VHSLIRTQQCVTTVIGCTGYGTLTFDSQKGGPHEDCFAPNLSRHGSAYTYTQTEGVQMGIFLYIFINVLFYFTTNYRLLVIQKAQWYAATETKTYAIYNMYIIYT
jgi:hypothetical protein